MTELNNWLKSTILNEFENVEVKEEWGNLIVNGKTFMIGENTNPYLNYKYSAYYENNGKDRKSFPLGDNYNTDLLRQIIEKVLCIVPITKNEKIEEKQVSCEEKEFTGGLFDFM